MKYLVELFRLLFVPRLFQPKKHNFTKKETKFYCDSIKELTAIGERKGFRSSKLLSRIDSYQQKISQTFFIYDLDTFHSFPLFFIFF